MKKIKRFKITKRLQVIVGSFCYAQSDEPKILRLPFNVSLVLWNK